jgi:hypothetical protein
MAQKSRTAFMDALMAEPVRLAGCPDIVLTRGDAYQFYVGACGMDPHGRGFGSVDYMVFSSGLGSAYGKLPLDTPLTDLSEPWVVAVMAKIAEYARG